MNPGIQYDNFGQFQTVAQINILLPNLWPFWSFEIAHLRQCLINTFGNFLFSYLISLKRPVFVSIVQCSGSLRLVVGDPQNRIKHTIPYCTGIVLKHRLWRPKRKCPRANCWETLGCSVYKKITPGQVLKLLLFSIFLLAFFRNMLFKKLWLRMSEGTPALVLRGSK